RPCGLSAARPNGADRPCPWYTRPTRPMPAARSTGEGIWLACSFTPLALALLASRLVGAVEITIGIDRALQHQEPAGRRSRPLGRFLHRRERHIVHGQDDNPRQRRHVADEGAELMIGADH